MDYDIILKYFVGLCAIINPIGVLPIFTSITQNTDPQKRLHINIVANFTVFIVLIVSLFFGQIILDLFGVSIDAFRIAGGILFSSIAWTMLNGKLKQMLQNDDGEQNNDSVAIVPLAIPIMAGPGAISSTIVYSSHFVNSIEILPLAIVIFLFCLLSTLIFCFATILYKILTKTGILVTTRIMGLVMMSLGIELIVQGLKGLFPILSTTN